MKYAPIPISKMPVKVCCLFKWGPPILLWWKRCSWL